MCIFLPQPAAASSSLPSGQSLSPSQSQRFGTQAYDPGQLKSPGAQVTVPTSKIFGKKTLFTPQVQTEVLSIK